MQKILSTMVLLAAFTSLAPGQRAQMMRANIRGGGGDSGKCTIEVEVDGAADVEIRGDTAWLRTLQGQPASWRRFECNMAMPLNPVNFRFRGIDGRGRQTLVQNPNNGGPAVVRIEDPQNGREGYTFDVEWNGGGNYSNSGPYNRPYPNNQQYPNNQPYPNRNDPYYDDSRRNDPNYRGGYNSHGRGVYNNDPAQLMSICQQEVRVRADRQYGSRDIRFTSSNVDDRGARDRVVGSFDGSRGQRFDYTCTVDTATGQIRNLDIRRR